MSEVKTDQEIKDEEDFQLELKAIENMTEEENIQAILDW